MTNFQLERQQMTTDLHQRGIRQPAVLAAMRRVPREHFIAPSHRHLAYSDAPLPIAAGQTISQPYIVAYMIQALDLSPQDRVLEIGAGSGYAAAILSLIAAQVYTVERHQELAQSAARLLTKLGFNNIQVHWGDGSLGWPKFAPYDGIVVAAGGPSIPSALRQQLAIGGRLVMPVGRQPHAQRLIRLTRRSTHEFTREKMGTVRFVPLIGAQGWRDEEHGTSS